MSKATKLDHFGLHLQDSLGAMNEARKDGSITRDQWEEMLTALGKCWEEYARIFDQTVDEAAGKVIDEYLAKREEERENTTSA
jgi:hypothetical protein